MQILKKVQIVYFRFLHFCIKILCQNQRVIFSWLIVVWPFSVKNRNPFERKQLSHVIRYFTFAATKINDWDIQLVTNISRWDRNLRNFEELVVTFQVWEEKKSSRAVATSTSHSQEFISTFYGTSERRMIVSRIDCTCDCLSEHLIDARYFYVFFLFKFTRLRLC